MGFPSRMEKKRFHNLDAGSEVLRRAGSHVEESGSSEYLRTGVVGEGTRYESASKRVVIIGGSSGIGLATAHEALAEGAFVTIAGRSEDRLPAPPVRWSRRT